MVVPFVSRAGSGGGGTAPEGWQAVPKSLTAVGTQVASFDKARSGAREPSTRSISSRSADIEMLLAASRRSSSPGLMGTDHHLAYTHIPCSLL